MPNFYNPTPGPVVIDDGQVIGGGERAEVSGTALVKEHVDAGRLVRLSGDAAQAAQATKEENK